MLYAHWNSGLKMKKNEIIIISDYLLNESPGGQARVSGGLSDYLSKNFSVNLILRGLKTSAHTEKLGEVKVFRYYGNVFSLFKILLNIFQKQIKAINFHDPYGSFFCALYMSIFKIKIPCVYTFHSPWSEEYEIRALKKGYSHWRIKICSFIRKKMEFFALSKSSVIITESFYMNDRLGQVHGLSGKILILGVDTEKFIPINIEQKEIFRKKFNLPIGKIVFFTLRNLEPRMGIENLIKAISMLDKKILDKCFFVIGGEGYMKEELERLIYSLDLMNVCRLEGRIKDENLPSFYASCDAFILPTYKLEGFGLVSAEAMSCGLPVLATPIGANESVVGVLDKSLIFKGVNPQDIADGIEKFILRGDIASLSARARECAQKKYSFDSYALKTKNIITENIV